MVKSIRNVLEIRENDEGLSFFISLVPIPVNENKASIFSECYYFRSLTVAMNG